MATPEENPELRDEVAGIMAQTAQAYAFLNEQGCLFEDGAVGDLASEYVEWQERWVHLVEEWRARLSGWLRGDLRWPLEHIRTLARGMDPQWHSISASIADGADAHQLQHLKLRLDTVRGVTDDSYTPYLRSEGMPEPLAADPTKSNVSAHAHEFTSAPTHYTSAFNAGVVNPASLTTAPPVQTRPITSSGPKLEFASQPAGRGRQRKSPSPPPPMSDSLVDPELSACLAGSRRFRDDDEEEATTHYKPSRTSEKVHSPRTVDKDPAWSELLPAKNDIAGRPSRPRRAARLGR
ncbi:hypothetical protein DICA3_D22958 [Diutina catenulata]